MLTTLLNGDSGIDVSFEFYIIRNMFFREPHLLTASMNLNQSDWFFSCDPDSLRYISFIPRIYVISNSNTNTKPLCGTVVDSFMGFQ